MTEFRFEGHYYRWTVIDTHIVDGVKYALAESSIGDEAPCILFKVVKSEIHLKYFEKSGVTLPVVPKHLIIDDEVYDDIMIALEDNGIL